jgi:hypothetical protein
VPNTPDELADVAGIIVPGVGHFGRRVRSTPWIDAILAALARDVRSWHLSRHAVAVRGSDEAPSCRASLLSGRCYRLNGNP